MWICVLVPPKNHTIVSENNDFEISIPISKCQGGAVPKGREARLP